MAEKVKKRKKARDTEERLPGDAERLLAAILGVSLENGTNDEPTSGKASGAQGEQEQSMNRTVVRTLGTAQGDGKTAYQHREDDGEVSDGERLLRSSAGVSEGSEERVRRSGRIDGLIDTADGERAAKKDGKSGKANALMGTDRGVAMQAQSSFSGEADALINTAGENAAMVLSPSWSTDLAPHITGTMVNYYFVCQRKLWFFTHHLECEHDSDLVRMGKLLHQYSYMREEKEIDIDQRIVLDWYDRERNVVCEVKSSDHQEEAHRWQVLFYLWYLKSKGVQVAQSEEELQQRSHQRGTFGELRYPRQKQRSVVVLTSELEQKLETEILPKIFAIAHSETVPKRERKAICSPCAYYELCFVEEPMDKAEG